MRSVIEEIKSRVLISGIISRTVALKPKGNGEFIGLCPFHQEKTPSFTVSDNKGFYHCFACGAHGDVLKFIMETQNKNYNDTLNDLAKDVGVPIPKKSFKLVEIDNKNAIYEKIFEISTDYYQDRLFSRDGVDAVSYLKKRGLSEETIRKFRLGYAPHDSNALLKDLEKKFSENDILASTVFRKNENGKVYNFFRDRVIFPIFNRKNSVIAFGGRILNDGQPKYLNSPDNPLFKKGQELYAMNFVRSNPNLRNDRRVIIVEGYMDVISLAQAGFENVVAPLGTALKTSQIELLWQQNLMPILCLDNDAAGVCATIKTCKEILPTITCDHTIKIINITDAKDPDDFIVKFGKKSFEYLFNNAIELSDYLFENEKNATKLNTPENKSHLKKRLLMSVDNIKDYDLKSQYRKHFLDKFNQTIYKKYDSNKKYDNNKHKADSLCDSGRSESFVNSTMAYSNSDVELIFYILNLFPGLLKDSKVLNELERMYILSKELDKIRNHILSIADDTLAQGDIFDNTGYNINFNDIKLNKLCISKIEDEAGALHYLKRIFSLNTLNKLQKEIELILDELNVNPTESKFELFINFKKTEEQLKTELGII